MHGGSPLDLPLRVIWGGADGRRRNIFGAPRPTADPDTNQAYLAGGLIEVSGELSEANRIELRNLMVRLEDRMARGAGTDDPQKEELWDTALPGASGKTDNPGLPSGYTYLLQLIAHDMVDTVRAATIASVDGRSVMAPDFYNTRERPLLLDTIYGAGPDECPHAYRFEGSTAALPRTLLRTGPLRSAATPPAGQPPTAAAPPDVRLFCPFRDIARSSAPGEIDKLTETFIADQRNESHALMSQMTVLFHLLHNAVADMVSKEAQAAATPSGPQQGPAAQDADQTELKPETAFRQFLCARFAVTLIYRNIIEKDVLPRILHPAVHAAYESDRTLRLADGALVPAEFFAGAFRFGHALVRTAYRPHYRTNSDALRFFFGLQQSARRNLNGVPVSDDWAVDWARFFVDPEIASELAALSLAPAVNAEINFARRIGPFFSDGLMNERPKTGEQPTGPNFPDRGLPTRDFLTASYTGLWSVPALFREMKKRLQPKNLDRLLPDYAVWREPLRAWLKDYEGELDPQNNHAARLSAREIDLLVADPPLPFFILFEAAHELDENGNPRPAIAVDEHVRVIPGTGGRTLGTLGSFLVADTFYGILRSRPLGVDESVPLRERIKTVSGALLGLPDALSDITTTQNGQARPFDTMPDLLRFLRARNMIS